jgi:hypothetical protein
MLSLARLTPVFSALFAIAYVIIEQNNLALFTYHPRINEWGWLTEAPRNGPGMYWYGWLASSALAAGVLTLVSAPLLRNRPAQTILGWAVPLACMVLFVYLLRAFFFR